MTRHSSMSKLCHALVGGVFVAAAILPATSANATGPKDRWAVVNADGSLARSNRALTAALLGSGSYEVVFDRNVTGCSYQATLGNASTGGPPIGQIGTSPRTGQARGVFIHTTNSAGTNASAQFHLYVHC